MAQALQVLETCKVFICLAYEIAKQGLIVEKQKKVPLIYENVYLDVGFRIYLLIEQKVILELKTVEKLEEIHRAQVLYLPKTK